VCVGRFPLHNHRVWGCVGVCVCVCVCLGVVVEGGGGSESAYHAQLHTAVEKAGWVGQCVSPGGGGGGVGVFGGGGVHKCGRFVRITHYDDQFDEP
jgi:hypothetical protein